MPNHQHRIPAAEAQPRTRRLLRPIATFLVSTLLATGATRDTHLPDAYTVRHPGMPAHDDETLRVMTANLHGWESSFPHDATQAVFSKTLRETMPDVVCTQEVVDGPETSALLRRYNSVFAATKRDFTGRRFGNLIFSTAPLELERVVPLPNTLTEEPRNLLIARLLTHRGWIRIGNVHLSVKREESTEQIQYIDRLPGGPLDILCGDFNQQVPQQQLGGFRKSATFVTLPGYTEKNRAIATFPSRLPVLAIDHIFTACSSEGSLLDVTTRTRYIGSDHDALLGDIALSGCPSLVTASRE